ncbi:MAG: hypothetical protein P8Y23_12145, partial [Candidatus Lokiarchaeota archaeon]
LNINKIVRSFSQFISISIFIYLTISNTIISGIEWYNVKTLEDEDFQVIGWISKNLPNDAKILFDDYELYQFTDELTFKESNLINIELENAVNNYSCYNINKNIDPNCSIDYLEDLEEISNVIMLYDDNDNGSCYISIDFVSFVNYGTIDLNFYVSNNSKNCTVNYYTSSNMLVISNLFNTDGFYYYNGTGYQKIYEFLDNGWFHYKLDFESTNGNHTALNKNSYRISLNNITLGELFYLNNYSGILNMKLMTNKQDYNYSCYFNEINYSWVPNFKVEYCIFEFLLIIDYLVGKNINYLVLSKEITKYRKIAEEFIDIENELIPKLFSNKLYEYCNYSIYNSIKN